MEGGAFGTDVSRLLMRGGREAHVAPVEKRFREGPVPMIAGNIGGAGSQRSGLYRDR